MKELYYDVLKRKDGVTRLMICSRLYGRFQCESYQEFEETEEGKFLLEIALNSIKNLEQIDDVNDILEALDSR